MLLHHFNLQTFKLSRHTYNVLRKKEMIPWDIWGKDTVQVQGCCQITETLASAVQTVASKRKTHVQETEE